MASNRSFAGSFSVSMSTTRVPPSPRVNVARSIHGRLEDKGHVRHEEEGLRYVYMPAVARTAARKSALRHLVDTFFEGSTENVVAALLGGEGARLTDEELQRIALADPPHAPCRLEFVDNDAY